MKTARQHSRWLLYLVALFASYLTTTAHIVIAQGVTYQPVYTLPQFTVEEPNNGALVQGQDGALYGATGSGAFYKVTTSGAFTKLYQFPDEGTNTTPYAWLQGGDGNLYGAIGGIIRITPSGEYSEILALPDADDLTLGSGGYYYATSLVGGGDGCEGNGCGEVVRFTLNGKSTIIYTFTGGADGGYPDGLMQASDGNFYGYSLVGGDPDCSGSGYIYSTPGCGTIFRLTPSGTLTVLENLEVATAPGPFGMPTAPIEAGDGNLYESIPSISGSYLTIYKIALPSGKIISFYTFPASESELQALTPGSENQIYGFTEDSVFDITTSGEIGSIDGGYLSDLLLASDGNVYGNNDSEIFRLQVTPPLTPPVRVTLSPSSVTMGKPVTGTLKVNNAFSLTMQQCYGFQVFNGVVTPLGLIPGTYNASSKLYTFSTTFTPTQAGTYTYSVTCGGVESGQATLTVE